MILHAVRIYGKTSEEGRNRRIVCHPDFMVMVGVMIGVMVEKKATNRSPLFFHRALLLALLDETLFLPEFFGPGVHRCNDTLDAAFDAHFLEGLFLSHHMGQAFFGIDQ